MAVKGVIFDLDGTLVDTLEDLTASMNFALASMGFAERSAAECREMIGHGVVRFAEEAMGTVDVGRRDRLLEVMRGHYLANCLNRTRVYEGVSEVIEELAERQLRLAVLTNKNQAPSEVIVRHYFGVGTFDPIVGNQPGRAVKPEPGGVMEILEAWGLRVEDAVLAGDSEADAQTASGIGMRFVACEWGFRSREQLVEAGAQILIQHPRQILEYVNAQC